jgi:uncharacterized damage-inducible protein DinB
MKKIFTTFALYNRKANESMFAIFEKVPEENLSKDVGTFFKSTLGVAAHIVQSDANWLKRFGASFPAYASVSGGALDRFNEAAVKEATAAGSKKLFALRKDLDAVIERFAAELREEDFEKPLVFKNMKGEEQRKVFWPAILHMFNHATHHRGQIADILDRSGVSNDFSGLLAYL